MMLLLLLFSLYLTNNSFNPLIVVPYHIHYMLSSSLTYTTHLHIPLRTRISPSLTFTYPFTHSHTPFTHSHTPFNHSHTPLQQSYLRYHQERPSRCQRLSGGREHSSVMAPSRKSKVGRWLDRTELYSILHPLHITSFYPLFTSDPFTLSTPNTPLTRTPIYPSHTHPYPHTLLPLTHPSEQDEWVVLKMHKKDSRLGVVPLRACSFNIRQVGISS